MTEPQTKTVVTVAPTTSPQPGHQIPADAPKSPALKSLAAKRQALRDTLYLDLQVPRWTDPDIFVRFGPINITQTESAVEKRRTSKSTVPDWLLWANADILSQSCIGIYATLDGNNDVKYSLKPGDENGKWTRFDPDLAAALGLPDGIGAADVVKSLYLTDGDLLSAATALTEWSGTAVAQADSDF